MFLKFQKKPMPPHIQKIYEEAIEVATYYRWDHYEAVSADKSAPPNQKLNLDSKLPGIYDGESLHGKGHEDLLIFTTRFTNDVKIYIVAAKERILVFETYGPNREEQRLKSYRPGEGDSPANNWELRLKELYQEALIDHKRYDAHKNLEKDEAKQKASDFLDELKGHTNFNISDTVIDEKDTKRPTKRKGFLSKLFS